MNTNAAPDGTTAPERKRRHHHRSRNGCVSCKAKHMRCDESKPFWLVDLESCHLEAHIDFWSRNCLKNGSSCGYARVEGSTEDRPQQLFTAASPVEEVSSNSLLAAYLNKPSPLLVPATVSNLANGSSGDFPMFGSPSPLASSFAGDMMDPFSALSVVMSHNSNTLLDHCESRSCFPTPICLRRDRLDFGYFKLRESSAKKRLS